MRGDLGVVLRLLAVGLPLTILAGWGLAAALFPALGVWLALLVGAGAGADGRGARRPGRHQPGGAARVRRLITVESGLNDGIATPIVLVAIAGAAAVEDSDGPPGWPVPSSNWRSAWRAVWRSASPAVRCCDGPAGEDGLPRTSPARRPGPGPARLRAAFAVDGNGFVAAFCGGIAFGAAAGRRGPAELVFLEQTSGAVSLLVWLAFGAIAVPILFDRLSWTLLLYAVSASRSSGWFPSPSPCRTGLDRNTVLFMGWFGPRGLASLVFALLALEELGSGADEAVAVIAATVSLSVLRTASARLRWRHGTAPRWQLVPRNQAAPPRRGPPRRSSRPDHCRGCIARRASSSWRCASRAAPRLSGAPVPAWTPESPGRRGRPVRCARPGPS